MKNYKYLLGLLILLMMYSSALALEIPITVEEPAGIERISEPITSGVPLPPGTQTTNWSLWEGTTEIPLQITKLQGRTPWILLDFQIDVPASGKKSLLLRDTPPAKSPAKPVTITEDENQIMVNTGPLKVLIKKNPFNLLETIWIDRDKNGNFSDVEQIINAAGDNIQIVDSTSGKTFSGTGTPDKLAWEYQGAMRATLRVDGRYRSSSDEFIAYTSRIYFYAGQSFVKIEHVLRNSYQSNERHVKIKSASIKIGNGTSQLRSVKSNSLYWTNVGSNGVMFELLPTTMGISYVGDNIDVDQNGGWLLPDLTHEGRYLIADFSEGLPSTEQSRLMSAAPSPLFAMASPSWYSEYGELSTSKFSTLEDEKKAYQKWGWTWTSDQEPKDAHKPDHLVYWWPAVHADTEADDLWQNILMYLRTGSRGYWDRAMGWAWYYKHHYPFRTDGFDFAWNGNNENPKIDRPLISIPLTSNDQSYIGRDLKSGKVDSQDWGGDHMWGWGLIDYYYLTGDVNAIEAAVDLSEISFRILGWWKPGPYQSYGNGYNAGNGGFRQEARQLLLVSRVYEVTLDTKWKDLMDHIVQLFLQSADWDERGFYHGKFSGVQPEKVFSPIHFGNLSQAFHRYFQITGNTQVKDRLVIMAHFIKQYGLHKTYNYTGYRMAMDYPNYGDVWHQNFDDGGLSGSDPIYTIALVDTLVRGYRLSGDQAFLERAKFHWDRGSKGVYGDPLKRTAGDNNVGRFANNKIRGSYYSSNGDIPYNHLVFYDYAHSTMQKDSNPPSAPTNLRIK